MNRAILFLVMLLFAASSAFGQTVKVDTLTWEEGQESFIPGCGLTYEENDYRYLQPEVKALIDSGLVNFNPNEFKVIIHPQADGTKQKAGYEPSQLFGINQKMQKLRFAFLKAYLADSLGYEVELGEYRFSVEKGPEHRGAYVSFVRKTDSVIGVEAQNVSNAAGAITVQEEVVGVQFRVDFFRIPANDTTRWIDCRALLVTNMGLLESDSIRYEASHPLAGTVDQQGRFRSKGVPGVFTVYAKYGEHSDFCNILVEGAPKAKSTEKVVGSIAERTDVLGYVNSNSAFGGGVMMQFKSGLLIGITDAVQRWDNKSENTLNAFLGYGFNTLSNLRFALIGGPIWHSELDDNKFDAFGGAAGLHGDLQFGRLAIFGQLLVVKMMEHQHGKSSPSRIYQDPNDPNTIGVKNDVIREDKKYWRDPEMLIRAGLSIQL